MAILLLLKALLAICNSSESIHQVAVAQDVGLKGWHCQQLYTFVFDVLT